MRPGGIRGRSSRGSASRSSASRVPGLSRDPFLAADSWVPGLQRIIPQALHAAQRTGHVTCHDLAISRRDFARALQIRLPLFKQRAQGMPGARCTRGLVCQNVHFGAHEHTGSGNTPTSPAQWLYGVLRALPGERIRLVTVDGGIFSTGLAPATGVRTTRLGRTLRRFVRRLSTILSEQCCRA
jgi:hypothetical protein